MREALDDQLREVLEQLLLMGGRTESMIQLAVRGLLDRDASLGTQVDEIEREVNALEIDIDERVIAVMIQQQPVARDARFVVTASRIAANVERMADQAVNVCQNTAYVLQSPPCDPLPDLDAMGYEVQQMVSDGLAALATRDVSLAEKVLEVERKVDRLRDQLFRTLLRCIITDPLTAQRSLSLILISRNLEKIGDYASNVAEEVIYLVRGQDVRHRSDRPVRANSDDGSSA
jgi:phosphate transport system protein